MNSNFGILPPLSVPVRRRIKKELMSERALNDLDDWKSTVLGGPAPIRAELL